MCLSNKVEVSIEKVEAYKLFYYLTEDDALHSFYRQPQRTPNYDTNKVLSVDPPDSFHRTIMNFTKILTV